MILKVLRHTVCYNYSKNFIKLYENPIIFTSEEEENSISSERKKYLFNYDDRSIH